MVQGVSEERRDIPLTQLQKSGLGSENAQGAEAFLLPQEDIVERFDPGFAFVH